MNESDHKKRLVKAIKDRRGMARRFEDRYAVGLLDLQFKLPGLSPAWAECKMVEGNKFAPTPAQFQEGLKWLAVGMPVILIGWKNGTMYVSPWTQQADIHACYQTPTTEETLILWEYLTWRRREKIDEY